VGLRATRVVRPSPLLGKAGLDFHWRSSMIQGK